MAAPENTADALNAEEAINAVLDAEQRSRDALDRRRAEAQRLVADARETARRIHERANARSVAMRQLCERSASERTDALARATESARARAVQPDVSGQDLERALAALAAELTGGNA